MCQHTPATQITSRVHASSTVRRLLPPRILPPHPEKLGSRNPLCVHQRFEPRSNYSRIQTIFALDAVIGTGFFLWCGNFSPILEGTRCSAVLVFFFPFFLRPAQLHSLLSLDLPWLGYTLFPMHLSPNQETRLSHDIHHEKLISPPISILMYSYRYREVSDRSLDISPLLP